MFKNVYQKNFLNLFCAAGNDPLVIWKTSCTSSTGSILRVMDEDLNKLVLQIYNNSIQNGRISCPKSKYQTLGIRLPIFVMQVKNFGTGFMFVLYISTRKNSKKVLRATTGITKVEFDSKKASIPLNLNPGWNTVVLNLEKVCQVCFNEAYLTVDRLVIHANCRLRRAFFSDRTYEDSELPPEYKITIKGQVK